MNDVTTGDTPLTFTPEAVFTPGGVERVLDQITRDALAVEHDAKTPGGRKLIASAAYRVARTKTTLDEMGKKLTDEWRARTDAVNADRRTIRTRLDALADQIRSPLTAWETKEKSRVASHEAAVAEIAALADLRFGITAAEIADRIGRLSIGDNRDWEEFRDRASNVRADVADKLNAALVQAEAREAQAAELERLRAAEEERARQDAERQRAERDAKIAADAADKARREAEAEAERKAKSAANAAAAAQAKAEADRREAVEAAKRADERARHAEAERAAQAERSERDRLAAIEAERARQAQAEADARAEEARRAANRAHRSKINNAAAGGLIAAGLPEDLAKAAVTAIARGAVPHISIAY